MSDRTARSGSQPSMATSALLEYNGPERFRHGGPRPVPVASPSHQGSNEFGRLNLTFESMQGIPSARCMKV